METTLKQNRGATTYPGPALDAIDWRLLRALQANGRLPFTELGRRVGLTSPAVAERVRRMEETGVIANFRAEVDPAKVGLPITAFVRVTTSGAGYERVIALARDSPEVLECHRLTGEDCFLMKLAVASITHLEAFLDRLRPHGQPTTSIALSSPVVKRDIGEPDAGHGRA